MAQGRITCPGHAPERVDSAEISDGDASAAAHAVTRSELWPRCTIWFLTSSNDYSSFGVNLVTLKK